MTLKLSAYLRAVPLARRTPAYYGAILAGDAAPCAADENAWNSLKISSVLELSAGQTARWTQSVAALGGARRLVAADLAPPACDCAKCVAADNRDLGALASAQAPFDLVYGAHVLCTCQAPAFLAAAAPRATCGGVPLDNPRAVYRFVGGLKTLLDPSRGVAVFDHEGGWPFGLETTLRRAARFHRLHFYVRRGPLWTNFDYVLSAAALEDDVSNDPLQASARASDALLVAFPAVVGAGLVAAQSGAIAHELLPRLDAARKVMAAYLACRLVLPFCDVLALGDAWPWRRAEAGGGERGGGGPRAGAPPLMMAGRRGGGGRSRDTGGPPPRRIVRDASNNPVGERRGGGGRRGRRPRPAPGSSPTRKPREGERVSVVQKADYGTAKRAVGTVARVLTRAAEHPRGFKVELVGGVVGRVCEVVEEKGGD